MKRTCLLSIVAGIALSASSLAAQTPGASWEVSSQGRIVSSTAANVRTSPRGSLRLELVRARGDEHLLRFDVRMRGADGREALLEGVRGNGFLASDVGLAVVIDAHESNQLPTRVVLHDLDGSQRTSWSVPQLADPRLSSDGRFLAYRSARGTEVIDLVTLDERRFPALTRFDVGEGGQLIGTSAGEPETLVVLHADGSEERIALGFEPSLVAFGVEPGSALVLTREALHGVELSSGLVRELHRAQPGSELRDLRVTRSRIMIGAFANLNGTGSGSLLQMGAGGVALGPTTTLPMPPPVIGLPMPKNSIPWPLDPSAAHSVGNSYGEYQNYGGSPYLHPGIDVLGFDGQPVYAVAGGVVKAILTTSGQYHWRIAIGQAGGGTSEGYLYAHVDQPTVTVNVGDAVVKGQYLGDLVPWPVAGFTHCHFARIEDSGVQWNGSWLCTDNPQPDMVPQVDSTDPLFEPAIGADLFAFCFDETSNYRDPGALTGEVDIVARVSDTVLSSWRCAVQGLRYSIWPVGQPGQPIVSDKLAVRFDMALDTYQGGPIDPFLVDLFYKEDGTCDTDGDYGSRDFYHVLTNSDGDELYEASDVNEAWDTTVLSDGDYVVEVTAWDVSGNSSSASMVVTTANGNP